MTSIKSRIRTIPNYPKDGIMFRDITTLLSDPEGFGLAIDRMAQRYTALKIDKVVGIEARGFIFGAPLAHQLKVGFVPIRKKGKLPFKTISHEYELEYGTGTIEIHTDGVQKDEKVVLVDDLLATGGTAEASIRLVEQTGGRISECCFVVDLPDIGGRKRLQNLGYDVFSLCEFSGE